MSLNKEVQDSIVFLTGYDKSEKYQKAIEILYKHLTGMHVVNGCWKDYADCSCVDGSSENATCSSCGERLHLCGDEILDMKYCPFCGAKMQ